MGRAGGRTARDRTHDHFRVAAAVGGHCAVITRGWQNGCLNEYLGQPNGLVVVGLNLLDQAEIDVLRNANIVVLNDNTVQVPINVAAILCNTEVNVIASGNQQGNKTCDAKPEGIELFSAQ
jgi:hypothetical protein